LTNVIIKTTPGTSFRLITRRQFWESLPGNIRPDYIKRAEGYLDYNWPVVRVPIILKFIRSGDRRQSVYSMQQCPYSLVMENLLKAKGVFN